MSQWSHVNACIRFDSFLRQGTPTEKELGKMCRWEDESTSHWENAELPCGSEGSIEYTILSSGGENSLAANVVAFYGDLRDYENKQEIIDYFERITKDKMIRSGVLEISIEFQETFIFMYDRNASKWKEVYKESNK